MNRITIVLGVAAVSALASLGFIAPPPHAPEKAEPQPSGADDHHSATPIAMPTMADDKPRDYHGLHNVVAYHDGYLSGSVPEGIEGFDTLKGMGIKTIISVDGAVPDVELARARGLRYIHLPIGYNGFDDDRKLELVRATRDAMKEGPVYIHCHHGKHRSAGAAAAVVASLGWLTPEKAVERMKVSGTAPNYTGLYKCATDAKVLDTATIDSVPADFPEVSQPGTFVKAMVEIDYINDHIKAVEKAGWVAPKDHPDLVPVAEAGRMADLFRLLMDNNKVKSNGPEFAASMQLNGSQAQQIEDLLLAGEKDVKKLSEVFKQLQATCKDCHVKFRD